MKARQHRFTLDDGGAAHRHFFLMGELQGPDASRRSIEQLARTITAHHPKFGSIELTSSTFAAFIKNFNDNVYGQEIYLDRHHDISHGVMGKIVKLFARDGKLLAEIEWTEKGVKTYSEDGFRYFSIDFSDDFVHPETKAHHGPVLFGAALTPRPFIKNMKPTDGPGRLTLSEGRSVFVPDYVQLNEAADMKKFLENLRKKLAAKKLSEAAIARLVKLAEDQATALSLGEDETKLAALGASIEASAATLTDAAEPAAAVQLSDEQISKKVGDAVAKALADAQAASKTLAETETANRNTFTDAIDGAKGLSDATRTLLKQQATAIGAGLSADQVKQLADTAITLGNQMEVAQKRAAIGLIQGSGSVMHVELAGDIGTQVHGLMREKLQLTDAYGSGSLRLPEEKSLTPFARKVLAAFDAIHGSRLETESKRLAGDGSTNVADGAFPVVAQRQVIVELLADLKFMAIVNTVVDPTAQATIQIPYEERNVSGIKNGGIVYEGQAIGYAGVRQRMDNAYIVPRKVAMLMSNEMIHFSRASMINWDAWGRNISSNSRLIRDLICAAIANEMQRSADLFGSTDVATENMEPQFNGTRVLFKTAQFPVVRPYQPKDLQGNNVGTALAPITFSYAGAPISAYDGTNTQAAGTYYNFTDWNLGYFQIVNQLGVPIAVADTTLCTVSYTYATNVAKFDIDVPGGKTYEQHLNTLLHTIGRRKALLQQQRFVTVGYGICSNTLHNTITEAEQFERDASKNGTDLMANGDLGQVKAIPFWGTNQPAIDLGDSRIILGERGTTAYGVAKPFATGMPFEVIHPDNGQPTGEKQAYGEEYSSIHTPSPLRGRMTSVIVYSATARTAV